ncbi:hypothetical protein LEQ41_03750 [Streptococcus agalactiae]|nr:hypothetical protein [Streptococcus agalactiae]
MSKLIDGKYQILKALFSKVIQLSISHLKIIELVSGMLQIFYTLFIRS